MRGSGDAMKYADSDGQSIRIKDQNRNQVTLGGKKWLFKSYFEMDFQDFVFRDIIFIKKFPMFFDGNDICNIPRQFLPKNINYNKS